MLNINKRRKILLICLTTIVCAMAAVLLLAFTPTGNAAAEKTNEVEFYSQTATIAVEDDCPHTYWTEICTVEPTCVDEGYTIRACTECGKEEIVDIQPVTGEHSFVTEEIAPTCTDKGVTVNICTVCNKTEVVEDAYTDEEGNKYTYIPALGHEPVLHVDDPTCQKEGRRYYVCSRCQDEYTDSIIGIINHNYVVINDSELTYAATCTTAGQTVSECSMCGERFTQTISALGHLFETVVVYADCTTQGFTTFTCTRDGCGYGYEGAYVEPYGHYWTNLTQISNNGYNYIRVECERCGEYSFLETIPPDKEHCDHAFEYTEIDADCVTVGCRKYYCTVCGEEFVFDEDESMLGKHDYVAEVIPPTCTEGGYTIWTCSMCGDSFKTDETNPPGHDYVAVITKPTCTEGGYTTYTCRDCGDVYTGSETDPTGHTYPTGLNTSIFMTTLTITTSYKCSVCGHDGVDELTLVFKKSTGTEITIPINSDYTADLSDLSDGSYTAYIYDANGKTISVFHYGEELYEDETSEPEQEPDPDPGTGGDTGGDSDTGSGDTSQDEPAHTHTYIFSLVSWNIPDMKMTVSYICSECGDNATSRLYVVYTGSSDSKTYSVPSTGIIDYSDLEPDTYTMTIYYSGTTLSSATFTVDAATEPDEDEYDDKTPPEHVHKPSLTLSFDEVNETISVSYVCECGEDFTSGLEVLIVFGNIEDYEYIGYFPSENGVVDYSGDFDPGTYSVYICYEGESIWEYTITVFEHFNEDTSGNTTSSVEDEESGNTMIVVLLIVFFVVLGGGIAAWVIYRRRSKRKAAKNADEDNGEEYEDGDDDEIAPVSAPSQPTNSGNGNNAFFDDDDDDD